MVRTDFEGLVASHDQPDLHSLLVLEQTDVACPSFLPLRSRGFKPEELCTPKIIIGAKSSAMPPIDREYGPKEKDLLTI